MLRQGSIKACVESTRPTGALNWPVPQIQGESVCQLDMEAHAEYYWKDEGDALVSAMLTT